MAKAAKPLHSGIWAAALGQATKMAVSQFKGFAALLVAFGSLIAAYAAVQKGIAPDQPWPIAIGGVPTLIFVFLYFIPVLRDALAQKRLENFGIHGKLKKPGYSRLSPYGENDKGIYRRPDG